MQPDRGTDPSRTVNSVAICNRLAIHGAWHGSGTGTWQVLFSPPPEAMSGRTLWMRAGRRLCRARAQPGGLHQAWSASCASYCLSWRHPLQSCSSFFSECQSHAHLNQPVVRSPASFCNAESARSSSRSGRGRTSRCLYASAIACGRRCTASEGSPPTQNASRVEWRGLR
jgi:hypothetical protein